MAGSNLETLPVLYTRYDRRDREQAGLARVEREPRIFAESLRSRQPVATRLLAAAFSRGRMAHAYLLLGGEAEDKERLALELAMFLNCGEETSCHIERQPSSYCQSCRWIDDRKHPQVWLELKNEESVSGKVSVEMARQLAGELARSSLHKRLVYVPDAGQEILHRPAANALLKTIEEPRGSCYFILAARSREQVLTTIVSRCQVIPCQSRPDSSIGPLYRALSGSLPTSLLGDDEEMELCLRRLRELEFFQPAGRRQESVSLANSRALELSGRLASLLSEGMDGERLIDAALLLEIEIIGSRVSQDQHLSYYLHKLMEHAEEAKLQLSRYVSKKPVLDCLALDWSARRRQLSG